MTLAANALCSLFIAGLIAHQAAAADRAPPWSTVSAPSPAPGATPAASSIETQRSAHHPRRSNFEKERPSRTARYIADWVVDSGDSVGMPFVIVDKMAAKVFVFDADGALRGAAPALLGLAHGDGSVPGIGDRPLSAIRPEERTTPAGRFVAALDHNSHGAEMLWVDYDTAISLHRVITSNPNERRAERLASPSPLDNRITFGCINVPAKFYDNIVSKAFTGTNGIVYVLPENTPAEEFFASSYDVGERSRLQAR